MTFLAVRDARVAYRRRRRPTVVALDGVTLEADVGELVAVVGESGSGKSTLLRAVAGLVQLAGGTVSIGGRDVTAEPPRIREVALVPQDLPLYPHLDVAANIAFGAAARRTPAPERQERTDAAVDLLGLGGVVDRRPESLSGGERQRVALARALVRRPTVFLLDEPLSGLTAATRLGLRADIKRIQRETAATMLYVTHDPQEAMAIGDRVAVLSAGRIVQYDAPAELFARPGSTAVARLVGALPMNLLPAAVVPGLSGAAAAPGAGGAVGAPASGTVGVRPERVRLVPPAEGRLTVTVAAVELMGEQWLVRLATPTAVEVLAVQPSPPALGAVVGISWGVADEHRFDRDGAAVPAGS